MSDQPTFDSREFDLILLLASSSASLDESPKKNWVERGGGLPPYVRKLARGIMKSGKSKSQAISIAIGRIKKWAAGGDDVNSDTRAKAAKALAQWEALKAKNAAKRVVKASRVDDGTPYLFLSNDGMQEFDTDLVRQAWDEICRAAREAHYARYHGRDEAVPAAPYYWIKSMWSTFIIVTGDDGALLKIPYSVDDDQVRFGLPQSVKLVYQEVEDPEWDPAWDGDLFEDADEDVEVSDHEWILLGLKES